MRAEKETSQITYYCPIKRRRQEAQRDRFPEALSYRGVQLGVSAVRTALRKHFIQRYSVRSCAVGLLILDRGVLLVSFPEDILGKAPSFLLSLLSLPSLPPSFLFSFPPFQFFLSLVEHGIGIAGMRFPAEGP